MKSKENLSLIIGIALPVLLIAFVAGAIYLPKFFIDGPKYDFIYTDAYSYDFHNYYDVIDGKLTKVDGQNVVSTTYMDKPAKVDYEYYYSQTHFYLHDLETNESLEISFEGVQEYSLDDDLESPDGFTIERGSGGGLFYPGNYDKVYIKGKGISEEVDLHRTDYYYYSEFTFVGWVIPAEAE